MARLLSSALRRTRDRDDAACEAADRIGGGAGEYFGTNIYLRTFIRYISRGIDVQTTLNIIGLLHCVLSDRVVWEEPST